MLSQSHVCFTLIGCGLHELGGARFGVRYFEAFGAGKVRIVHVCADGEAVFYDADGLDFYRGRLPDEGEVRRLTSLFGHVRLG